MSLGPGTHALWPTPVGVHRLPEAAEVNAGLLQLFAGLRLAQTRARGVAPDAPFFASDDTLLPHLQALPEGQRFLRFVGESLRETVGQANAVAWADKALALRIDIQGMWFQCSRQGAFHDVHTHANCSWSAAYIVQIDPTERRVAHPVYGAGNGVTRFYGPSFTHLAGAWVDLGNAYLLPPQVDVAPVAGQLVLFPSWLPHKALPYDGASERVIISFNASITNEAGGNLLHQYGPG